MSSTRFRAAGAGRLAAVLVLATALLTAALLTACSATPDPRSGDETSAEEAAPAGATGEGGDTGEAGEREPWASTYRPLPATPTLIENATVLTGTGERLDGASVLLVGGEVEAVGSDLSAPAGARVVDAAGRWVTPGLIDVHSHLGVYPSPGVESHSDGNELTGPVTANVWAEHAVWPQDPGFATALAGGVTTMQVLPGSGNLFGGRGVTLKNVPSRTAHGMKFPGAPHSLKMACGENPKRYYGSQGRAPGSRMGNVAGYRAEWIKARQYRDQWDRYEEKLEAGEAEESEAPQRDLGLETLAGVLDGEILVHNHCYRADEMVQMLDVAREFGYEVTAFHHAVEAYKIADVLAEEGVCGALWADWWGFKMEAYDGIRENLAFVDRPEGGCAIVHSDSEYGIQRLNQEAAKAMAAGRRAGLEIPPERAIRWVTANAAKALGLTDRIGTLEPGKNADVVVWSGDPFSVYTVADQVYLDGALLYDREDAARRPVSDFRLGQPSEVAWTAPAVRAGVDPRRGGALVGVRGPSDPSVVVNTAGSEGPRPATGEADGEHRTGGSDGAGDRMGTDFADAGNGGEGRDGATGETVVAIVGGTVHTQGVMGTVEGATVLVRGDRVVAVGADVAVPAGARVVDAAGKVVTPGFIDSAGQLGLVEVGAVSGSRDTSTQDDQVTAAFRVGDALNPASTLIPVTRVEGVTRAVVVPGTGASLIAGQGALVHLGVGPGDGPREMIVREPVAMWVELGEHGAGLAGGSRAAALLRLREALADAEDWAANRDAWERGARRDYALSRLDLEALQPVLAGEVPLVVAAERASDLLTALRLRDDFPELRLIFAEAGEAWLVADELAAAGTPVLVQPLANLPASFESLAATLENAARLHAAGVRVAFMSGGAHDVRNLRQDAGNAVAHGLPWEAGLAALTSTPAEIWEMAGEIGCLEPGCAADVVVWDGDPLELMTYPQHVFIAGEEMPRASRQLELRDRYRELPGAGERSPAYSGAASER